MENGIGDDDLWEDQDRPVALGHENPPAIVIAVDFGTTYSGIAWGLTADPNPDRINLVKSWPGKDNLNYQKVPSEISYEKRSGPAWGFKARNYSERLQWIKLLLDPAQNRNIQGLDHFLSGTEDLIPPGKTACDVVADYLSGLREHVQQEISGCLGANYFESTPKEYVFTVPAIWSDRAKALTQKAAKIAGFISENSDKVRLVTEPEAAALCCLRTIQPNHINIGDNFVVCDAGGGTVDLISYEILSLNPMEVKESAVGDGDLCGSVVLNSAFEKLVRERIGAVVYDNLSRGTKELLMTSFDEDVKRSFSDDEDEEIFTVPITGVRDNEDAGIEGGFFVMTRDEMREIFAPVLWRIEQLVENQVSQIRKTGGRISALLLVGGFGSSKYLLKHLKEWGINNGGILVLQPQDAWSSIVKGAAIYGLEGDKDIVRSRLSRRYYGTGFSERYIPGVHPEKYKYWNKRRNGWYADQRVKWLIRKGDKIEDNEPLESDMGKTLFMDEFHEPECRVTREKLYAYDGDVPPRYTDNEGVHMVTSMTSHLDNVPKKLWKRKNYGGEEDVMQLDYSVRMIVHDALLKLQIRCHGKQYGTVITKFE